MRMKSLAVIAVLALFALPALAQDVRSDLTASFTGNFQKQASGLGLIDSPTYSGGLLLSYRYHFNRSSAIEVNYARSQFSQYYSPSGSFTQAGVNEASLAYVYTFSKFANSRFRPFVEGGTGALIFSPIAGGSVPGALTQDRAAFLYGGGVDWRATHRLALRAGYRGLIYRAPDFTLSSQLTNAMTHTAEPYVGLSFRF